MTLKPVVLLTSILLLFFSCEESKEYKSDEVNSIDKEASIETELSVKHDSANDILITKHKIWRNEKLVKEIVSKDTIPALGDTIMTAPDSKGNDITGKIKKDYEFYITVQ